MRDGFTCECCDCRSHGFIDDFFALRFLDVTVVFLRFFSIWGAGGVVEMSSDGSSFCSLIGSRGMRE